MSWLALAAAGQAVAGALAWPVTVASSAGGHFSYRNVALALVMVALAGALSYWQRLGVERDLLLASVRAFVQLMIIGYVINFILDTNRLLLVLAMIAAMVAFAAFTSGRRIRRLPGHYVIMATAIGLSSVVTLVLMVGLGIISSSARYVIPIGGMIVGNSMNTASVLGVRLLEDATVQRAVVEAALALGASPRQAVHRLVRQSVRLAMIPIIDNTKTMGIVFLPGAMTGMILAGAKPLDAVRLQVVVMYMLLAAVSVTATVVALLVARRLFTSHQQLRRLQS
jgi:putative ABC transport system permease protein